MLNVFLLANFKVLPHYKYIKLTVYICLRFPKLKNEDSSILPSHQRLITWAGCK